MKRNQPEEYIKIMGQTVEIIRAPLNDADGGVLLGETLSWKNQLFINNTTPEDVQSQTLGHEILHYISDIIGLSLTEEQVTGLDAGLWSIGVRIKTKKRKAKK